TNSGLSWLSSAYDRTGLAEEGHASGKRGCSWACSFVVAHGLPPWQSAQPRFRVAFAWGSTVFRWQARQPSLLRAASAAVCRSRSAAASSGGTGNGSVGEEVGAGWAPADG